MRPLRQRVVPARRRPRGDDRPPSPGVRKTDRAAGRLLSQAWPVESDRRGRRDRADSRPRDRGFGRSGAVISLKSAREIEVMRRANVIVAEVLEELKQRVAPGVTTLELDELAEEQTLKRKAIPAFKGYNVAGRVYRLCLCASVNEEIVHGVPSNRALREGDIIGLDYGVIYEGFYGDSAVTVGVSKVSPEAQRLMDVTEESLYKGIEQLHDGKRLGDLGSVVQRIAENAGYSVVRAFVGHGIGRKLHEEPPVPNYGEPDRGLRLREGMVLAIEPMVNIGGCEVEIKEDGWTAVTKDGSLAAHFEHSVAITKNGPYILSQL